MRFALDSNIPVYAAQKGDERHELAAALLRRAVQGDCVQTMQSLGECFNALCRKRGFSKREARAIIECYLELFDVVVAANTDDPRQALRAASAQGFQYWDAMLWATAWRVGCELILSEDGQDGRSLQGVAFVNPFNEANNSLLDRALPPLDADR
jgi:predicted nucleic acid-binding protein